MPRMPGAVWKPLAANWYRQPRMTRYDLICIHTMVGSLAGTDSYFRSGNGVGFAGTESHFGTGGYGEAWQWQDTAFQADANGDGNGRIISIENADLGPGFPRWNLNDPSAVPAFTDAQAETIAQIVAWACRTHDIPCVLVPDSRPGRRGISYHRQGCDPYRVAGGERWSSSYGKVCPGNARIAQIPQIIARARQILGGVTVSATDTRPEDSMPSIEDIFNADVATSIEGTQPFKDVVTQTWTASKAAQTSAALASAGTRALAAEVAGLRATLDAFIDAYAQNREITPHEIRQVIDAAFAENVVRVNVSVGQEAAAQAPPA